MRDLKVNPLTLSPEALYGWIVKMILNGVVINGNGCGFAPDKRILLESLGHQNGAGRNDNRHSPYYGMWHFEGTKWMQAIQACDPTMAREVIKDF